MEEITKQQQVLVESYELFFNLRALKASDPSNGRAWAIAATKAEELYAWICYVLTLDGDRS
jgi:hypothetical protein